MSQGIIEGKDFEELYDLINIMREHEWAEKKPCRKLSKALWQAMN